MEHPPGTLRQERRRAATLTVIAVVSLLVILAAIIPSPYIIERPGPVVDVLGDTVIDEETVPVIDVEGASGRVSGGVLNLVAVSLVGSPERPTSWLQLLPAAVDHTQELLPRELVFPDGISGEEREEGSAMLMTSSQSSAIVAAFNELGADIDTLLAVSEVVDDSPADGILQPGDLLRAADGEVVTDLEVLSRVLAPHGSGTPVRLEIERDGEHVTVEVVPELTPESEMPRLGIFLEEVAEVPEGVTIHLEDIGGPSAGLAFALGIIDLSGDESLVSDAVVTATGTVTASGRVGMIGGLPQKIWSAARAESELLLMPLENCGDLPDRLPEHLTIAPVETVAEATAAIEALERGETPAGLERCAP